jgi:hypothetical protein
MEVGRYNLFEDKHWIVYNETVQQVRNEGYDVPGEANWTLQVNYTRLDYTLKVKVLKLSWPNVTLQVIEGTHDLNVTARRIMENGSIGEKLASFSRTNRPLYVHPYLLEVKDPDLGVAINPSAFTIGNTFPTALLMYTVNRTETLTGTPWEQNETYVMKAYFANETHRFDWTVWCDAQSGIILRQKVDSETSTYTSYEETEITQTGIENDRFDIVQNGQPYQVFVSTTSTLCGFVFDSGANKISLTVDGPTGTSGVCNITVPKKLVPSGYGFEVYVDEQKADHTLTDDASNYYVNISYQHSTHTIAINIVSGPIWTQWWFWPVIIAVITVIACATYLLKRKPRTQTSS